MKTETGRPFISLLDSFWKRCHQGDLVTFRDHHRPLTKGKASQVKIDGIVHVYDEGTMLFWRLGLVNQQNRSNDGEIRSVLPKSNLGTISPPVSCLYAMDNGEQYCCDI